jgi:hypothetical protein
MGGAGRLSAWPAGGLGLGPAARVCGCTSGGVRWSGPGQSGPGRRYDGDRSLARRLATAKPGRACASERVHFGHAADGLAGPWRGTRSRRLEDSDGISELSATAGNPVRVSPLHPIRSGLEEPRAWRALGLWKGLKGACGPTGSCRGPGRGGGPWTWTGPWTRGPPSPRAVDSGPWSVVPRAVPTHGPARHVTRGGHWVVRGRWAPRPAWPAGRRPYRARPGRHGFATKPGTKPGECPLTPVSNGSRAVKQVRNVPLELQSAWQLSSAIPGAEYPAF